MKGTEVAEELKFEGKPKFAGIGLAKRTTEVRVLRGGFREADCSGDTGRYGRITKAGRRPLGAAVLRALLRPKEGGTAAEEISWAERADGENEKRGGWYACGGYRQCGGSITRT
jgi:hypothetical protein